jgi:hypothetical protein
MKKTFETLITMKANHTYDLTILFQSDIINKKTYIDNINELEQFYNIIYKSLSDNQPKLDEIGKVVEEYKDIHYPIARKIKQILEGEL